MKHRSCKFLAVILACSAFALAQDLASFEKRITVKKLDNGLTVIICERPEAPVFSFYTHVDAGSVQDPMGKTGLAHMFEHMALKERTRLARPIIQARKSLWQEWKPRTRPTLQSATKGRARRAEAEGSAKNLAGCYRRRAEIRQAQRISSDSREQRGRRIERLDRSGRNRLPLLAA